MNEPKIIASNQIIDLKLMGMANINGKLFFEKGQHPAFSNAYVNCDSSRGERIFQDELGTTFFVLAPDPASKKKEVAA